MLNWLRNLFARRSIHNPAVPISQALDYLASSAYASSGVAVNQDSALGYPAVWRGVNLIASHVARLPINCYRRLADARELASNHPGHWFANHPGQWYTKFQFFRTLTAHALVHGNGYAAIIRDADANPVDSLILHPEFTYPVIEGENLWYCTTLNGQTTKLLPSDVLVCKGLSFDGLMGVSVISVLREALGLGLALQRYASVYFGNGASPKLVLKVPHKLTRDQVEELKRNWSNAHQGVDQAHKLAVLTSGTELDTVQTTPEDSQFLQSREFDLKAVANILGIPPHKLGANITSSYASLEAENKAFLSDSLEHWLVTWEEELSDKLLTEEEKQRQSNYFEFKREALERADIKTETEVLALQLGNGILSLNEVRAIRNLSPVGHETADWHRLPSGTTFAEQQTEPDPEEPVDEEQEEPDPVEPSEEEQEEPDTEADPVEPSEEEPSEEQGERFRQLVLADCNRLLTRLDKGLRKNGKLDGHQAVFLDALRPASRRAEEIIGRLFEGLEQRLRTDGVDGALSSLSAEQLAEELCR